MIRGKCPTCGSPFEIAGIADLPSFPFCTERCKLVDLGRWIDERFTLPAEPPPSGEENDGEND